MGGGLAGEFSEGVAGSQLIEKPFTALDVYQRPCEKRAQQYHDRKTPPKRRPRSSHGEAFLCSPASEGVVDVEGVWQDVFTLGADTAGHEYYQSLLGESQADEMEDVLSIKSGEGPLPYAPWGPLPSLIPMVCIGLVVLARALWVLTDMGCSALCRHGVHCLLRCHWYV